MSATVTGTIRVADGTGFTGTIRFWPDRSVKVMSDGDVVTGGPADVQVTDGVLSSTIEQGAYLVEIRDRRTRRFRIVVPSSGAHDIYTLISSGAANLPTMQSSTYAFATFETAAELRAANPVPALAFTVGIGITRHDPSSTAADDGVTTFALDNAAGRHVYAAG